MVDWEQLQIEPTTEIGLIKKAYAARVKVIRPDEKPTEFSLLHNAYKSAIKYAKIAASQTTMAIEEQTFFSTQEEDVPSYEEERAPLHEEEEQAYFGNELINDSTHIDIEETLLFDKNAYLADQLATDESTISDQQLHEEIIENSFQNLVNSNEQNLVETPQNVEMTNSQQEGIDNLDDILQLCDEILSEDNSHIQFQLWSELSQNKALLNQDIHFKVSLYLINAIYALCNAISNEKKHKKYSVDGLDKNSILLLNDTFLWQEEREKLSAFAHSEALDSVIEYIDNATSDENKSLAAVQGGVSAINRYSEEEIAVYENAKNSLFKLKILFILWCLILLAIFFFSLFTTQDGLLFSNSTIRNLVLVISQFVLCFKLCQNNKLAFYCVGPIACVALFLIPFGTLWGIFTLRSLRKARHYFKFTNPPPRPSRDRA
ncbi:hypothetical protein GCM10009111_34920 [Colwellia asteriadis]|uniref:J domain-containing protein n=1 Tax=Colwellia asteriadis TaxID=517723 RepID=A0ABP3WR96_9GAMM